MKTTVFRGVGTALITPFLDGRIDYGSLVVLIDRQLDAGIDALVIGGTTGEAATLTDTERYELYKFTKEYISGRCKLIFGTGTNDTRGAIQHTEMAEKIGCDGALVVTPYYNKGTREGVARHYEAIADSTGLPIILYNVPSRTGVSLDIETVERLSQKNNIAGIKEASDSQERLMALSAIEGFGLYAGNDSAISTVLSLGGLGVISVVSNLYPKETMEICKQFFANNLNSALEMQKKLLPVINALFLETNPAPIKYTLASLGLCRGEMRLPMWFVTESTKNRIEQAVKKMQN